MFVTDFIYESERLKHELPRMKFGEIRYNSNITPKWVKL